MSRQDRIAQVAARYTGSRKYSGIEWHVEHRGSVLAEGRAGHADALAGTPIPDDFFYQRADGTSEVPFSIEIGTVIIPAPTSGAVALIGLALIRRRSR